MRRHQGPALVAGIGLAAILLLAAAALVPHVTGAPRPATADLVVVIGLGAIAARLAAAGRHATAATVLLASALWTLGELATSLPTGIAMLAEGLVLVPLAIVVVTLATSQTSRRRLVLPAGLATAAALAAGNGADLPVLAALGSALVTAARAARSGTPAPVRASTAALGIALVVLDPHVLGDALDPRTLATAVDLVLLAIAVTTVRQLLPSTAEFVDLGPGPGHGDDAVGRWLGKVLGAPPLAVVFPRGNDGVDAAGEPASYGGDALLVRDARGVVAAVTPEVRIAPAVYGPLVATLGRLGEVAWLRAECRDLAAAIATSRGRLQAAADDESRRLERQLDKTLLARLDRIDGMLATSLSPLLIARVDDVRQELLRHARGLDPLAGRSLSQALTAYGSRGVRVEIGALGDLDPSCARTAWYVATEGITNAVKHAPGARIALVVRREGLALELVVRDLGPGGADAQGAGLQGLADRVAAVGGRLHLTSGPAGTTLACVLPDQGSPSSEPREIADLMFSRHS